MENLIEENQTCPAVGYQRATVCVPVTVTPFAQAGETRTICIGSPTIISGASSCSGTPGRACVFTISQEICVAVPIEFGATATVGRYAVECGGASDAPCDEG